MSRTYYPGDCVDVGKQSAQRWVVDGSARFLTPHVPSDLSELADCGVALLGESTHGEASRAAKLRTYAPTLAVEAAMTETLPFARTLIWDADFPLRPELVTVGFGLLDRWEVAAPIVSYDKLACHVGTALARGRTEAVVRDLRVPLYESRLIFIKRCRAGRDLLAAWQAERETGDHDGLCLLRALYAVKPLLCALPCTWNRSIPAIA